MSSPGEVTKLLGELRAGDKHAAGELFSVFYKELRRLAANRMRIGGGQTMQPTALVNELYLEFVRQGTMEIKDKGHFFGVSSYLMKQLLFTYDRRKNNKGHGGEFVKEPLQEELAPVAKDGGESLLIFDDVLRRLGELDPQQLRIVELRLLEGRSVAETAAEMNLSERHVKREWSVAQRWLQRELRRGSPSNDSAAVDQG